MDSLREHAEALGTKTISAMVTEVDFSSDIKTLTLDNGDTIKTRTVIISTGAKARYLGLESEEMYKGKGVSACATCDGFFFRKKDVAVIGGGSAAFVEALYLTNLCNKVYIVHRREQFRAEKVLVDKLRELEKTGKVEFVLNANVDKVVGDGNKVTGAEIKFTDGSSRSINLDGIFVAIGHEPATKIFKEALELDEDGYIKTGFTTATSTSSKGVFAAGDCADRIYRQAITSAGEGCKAALDVEKYLLG